MARVLSGIQPTGEVHLGNYLGALRNWATDQHDHDSFYCVVDLHAVTLPQDPAELRTKTLELMATLVAVGIDPDVATLFVQSHVHEHSELAWLLECTSSMGELRRMTQFKDKAARSDSGTDSVSVGLFVYPVLQAADILLYDADRVPVGEDQKQHVELTRDVGQRFNHRYGDVFVLPEAVIPPAGARVMDLQTPTAKMSKSIDSPQGTVGLYEDPSVIERKVKRAVTDSGDEVRYDPVEKPGVSNLLSILAAATGRDPAAAAAGIHRYGDLKAATAEAVIAMVTPVRERFEELMGDRAELEAILGRGADKAQAVAAATLGRARDAMGFLPRP
jgi:tryptophanyl-tRNA synthetase